LDANLMKEVQIREYRGGSQGVSIPLGHGVRFRTSSIRGQLVTIGQRWEVADQGQLTVTDRRVIFVGRRRTLEFQFSKLVSLLTYTDGITLGVTNRQATSTFQLGSPLVLAQMVRASLDAGFAPIDERSGPQLSDASTRNAPRSASSTGSQSQLPRATAGGASRAAATGDRWSSVLAPNRWPSWLGKLLAEHPLAAEKTHQALHNLTVERLVLLANVQHNRCRRDSLRDVERVSRERASEQAWDQLLGGLSDMNMRENTAWTGTMKLLQPGAEPALERIRQMEITELIGVCQRLIQNPYAEARRRGII